MQHITPPFKGLRPKEVQRITAQLMFPVNVESERIKRQFILSVKAGVLLEPEALFQLLNGQHAEKRLRADAAKLREEAAANIDEQPAISSKTGAPQ